MFVRRYDEEWNFTIETVNEEQNEKEKERVRDEVIENLRWNSTIDTLILIELMNWVDMQMQLARDANDLKTRIRDLLFWTL